MEAVVIAFAVVEQQRCWFHLPGVVAAFKEIAVASRISHVDLHLGVPAVGDGYQLRVEIFPELLNDARKGIVEVLVFTLSEAVPAHDDAAAENGFLGIETSKGAAFSR